MNFSIVVTGQTNTNRYIKTRRIADSFAFLPTTVEIVYKTVTGGKK